MCKDKFKVSVPPSRLALYLSALVYPGAGQFAQKRWITGAFYAVLFSISFVILVVAIFEPIFSNLRLVVEFADTGKGDVFHPISFVKVLSWLGISVLVYLAGLLDTYVSYRWVHARRREAGLQEKT